MESQTPELQTPATATVTPAVPTPAPAVPEIPDTSSYESGGVLNKFGDFKIAETFTFALFMAASIYSIYYHRQALNKLNE